MFGDSKVVKRIADALLNSWNYIDSSANTHKANCLETGIMNIE